MVHPWMQGQVIVGESDEIVEPIIEQTDMQATVQNAPGSSFEGCEPDCFLPSTVAINVGGTVTWENPDDVPHTVTSGTSQDGPSGHFDSSLIMVGDSYSVTLDDPGIYDYFCMVHPWMAGKVVVGGSETVVEPIEPVVVQEESEPSDVDIIVENALGSSTRGCEETNSCFIPNTVTINAGETVTWENPDAAGHTTTSRVVSEQGIGGIIGLEWDSGLMLKGKSFSHTFNDPGIYDYFCTVHPWMEGQVIVESEPEEVIEEPNEEKIIEVVNVLDLAETTDIILMNGTENLQIEKLSLNEQTRELTISSWIKPDFDPRSSPQYTVVSKEGSFNLFVTNTKQPQHVPGISVFDGNYWSTVLIDSKIKDGWHHLSAVIHDQSISLYLDSVLIGTNSIPPQAQQNDEGEFVLEDVYMAKTENPITIGSLLNSVAVPIKSMNSFKGSISDITIITDALSHEQISNLYMKDVDIFQRNFIEVESVINGTVTTNIVTTESPELSASDCVELAKEMELYDTVINSNDIYTLVCQFPFDVIIPLNSRILWMETLNPENGPYHTIRSVDNVFSTGRTLVADLGFYDDKFTHGVYSYYDDLHDSFVGKIIISESTNSINIPEHGTTLDCSFTYSCYSVFVADINVGERVTWQNHDTKMHTVVSGTPNQEPDGFFESEPIGTYDYFSQTFDEPGIYDYYCAIHKWMQGKIRVNE